MWQRTAGCSRLILLSHQMIPALSELLYALSVFLLNHPMTANTAVVKKPMNAGAAKGERKSARRMMTAHSTAAYMRAMIRVLRYRLWEIGWFLWTTGAVMKKTI